MVHPLYHALLEVKAAPFLAPEPVSKHSLDLLPVRAVMHAPVVTLRTFMRASDIQVGGGMRVERRWGGWGVEGGGPD